MARSKYNVDQDTGVRTCDGIVFDSKLEMRFYKEIIKPGVEDGSIQKYELQKKYELQPKFQKDGKTIRPIDYVADFYIEYSDGSCDVVDTKGCPDSVANIKRKMFWYLYPDINYRWIVYVKKFGGWVTYEEANKRRKEEKRQRNERMKQDGKE